MDITINVPTGTDISVLDRWLPDDIECDIENQDGYDTYVYEVRDSEDFSDDTRQDAEYLCGIIETALPGADALIDGCAEWAQGEIRTKYNYQRGKREVELNNA